MSLIKTGPHKRLHLRLRDWYVKSNLSLRLRKMIKVRIEFFVQNFHKVHPVVRRTLLL